MSKLLIVFSLFLFVGNSAFAKINQDTLDQLVSEYFSDQENLTYFDVDNIDLGNLFAKPIKKSKYFKKRISCVDATCDQLAVYQCSGAQDMKSVGKACKGSPNGECVQEACRRLAPYDCNSVQDIQVVGKACAGNFTGNCMKAACNLLAGYDCNSFSNIKAIGKACRGVASSCIKSVCKKMGNYNCRSIQDIQAVGRTCRGE